MSLDRAVFFDDFSDPALACYYQVTPGIGKVVRRSDGFHYEIERAPDGAASAGDCLNIDSLGRPQSPSTKVSVRFSGGEWTLETCIEYDFRAKRNGRAAYFWLVHGTAAERNDESIALVRGADLDPGSHSLTLVAREGTAEPRSIALAHTTADKYWLRAERRGNRVRVTWSLDGSVFEDLLVYAPVCDHRCRRS